MTNRIAIVDTETTGLTPKRGARVIQIGIVIIINGKIQEKYESLINSVGYMPVKAQAVHHISMAMLRNAPESYQIWPRIIGVIGTSPVVSHNARFEKLFLEYEYAAVGRRFTNQCYCTLELARRRYRLRNYKLRTVGQALLKYSCDIYKQHRALSDALLTANIWLAMTGNAKNICTSVSFNRETIRNFIDFDI